MQVVAFKQDDHGVTVLLGDPTTGDVLTKLRGDLLVGADGVRSAVRSVLFSEAKPRHSGLSMFRGVVVAPRFLDGATKAVAGTSQHKLSVYPIEELPPDSLDGAACSKQLINVLATLPSQPEDLNNDLSYSSDGCSPQAILERLDSGPGGALQLPYLDHKTLLNSVPQLFLWPLVDRDPLESYARGRVVLLGDAAHPMYPVGSAGASSAIVDAHELAKALAKHRVHESASKAEVEAALKEYSNLRQPLMGELQANCRAMLPEQVLDAVASELPRDAEKVPEKYGKQLASNLKQVQQVASVDAAFAKQRLLQESNGIKNTSSGAVTVPLGLNKSILRRFSPLERLLLHNKGNLQSVVSAYFNADVKVVTRYSEPRRLSGIQGAVVPNVFDREVHLCIGVRRFAICRSTVEVQDPELGKEVAANKDGIENLLARLGLAPTVELMGAGKAVIQGIQTVTRQHRMRCSGIVVTQRTFYDLEALENETGAGVAGGEDIHYGVVHMDVHQPRHSESLGELA